MAVGEELEAGLRIDFDFSLGCGPLNYIALIDD